MTFPDLEDCHRCRFCEALTRADDFGVCRECDAAMQASACAAGRTPDTFVVRLTPESDWSLHTDGPSGTPF